MKGDPKTREHKDISVGNGLRIKRVVLHYDPKLQADEIRGHSNQYQGVQLLRAQQWIETLEVGDEFPPEHRGGFRGFAEFDKALEAELKKSEGSQHESFNGQRRHVSETKQKIRDIVREFAEEQGWTRVQANQERIEKRPRTGGRFSNHVYAAKEARQPRQGESTHGTTKTTLMPGSVVSRLICRTL